MAFFWLVAVSAAALSVLTMLGARRRGAGWPLALLQGLGFPVTWTVWYVVDERPRLFSRPTDA